MANSPKFNPESLVAFGTRQVRMGLQQLVNDYAIHAPNEEEARKLIYRLRQNPRAVRRVDQDTWALIQELADDTSSTFFQRFEQIVLRALDMTPEGATPDVG